MNTPQRTEDYLKTIYILSASKDVRACKIAAELGLSRPTVSVALKRLEQEHYLLIDQDNSITLTEKGLRVAKPIFDRYEVLRDLLISLGVEEIEAVRDACWLEHGLGETSYQALQKLCRERQTSHPE